MADNIDKRIYKAKLAVTNAKKHPEIAARLILFKYDNERMNEGDQFCTDARKLYVRQVAKNGDQHGATAKIKECRSKASSAHSQTYKVSKIVFKDDSGAQTSLGLRGRRLQSLSGWLPQTLYFYVNLLGDEDFINRMAYFGYDRDKLEAEYVLVKAVEEAVLEQKTAKGKAQNATKERDAKVAEMDRWMSDFRAIAKMALADKSQLLESLGFGAIK